MKKLVSWVEIPANDIKRAVGFYNSVFNLNLEIADFGEEKMACFPNGEGAISQAPNFKPSENGLLVSFDVGDSISSTLETVQQNKGKIITPRTKIEAEGRGYFAVVIDSEGNKIGLYED